MEKCPAERGRQQTFTLVFRAGRLPGQKRPFSASAPGYVPESFVIVIHCGYPAPPVTGHPGIRHLLSTVKAACNSLSPSASGEQAKPVYQISTRHDKKPTGTVCATAITADKEPCPTRRLHTPSVEYTPCPAGIHRPARHACGSIGSPCP